MAANDLIVRSGHTANLQGGSSQPVTFSFNTITVEPGGRITTTGIVKILSNTFTQQPGNDGSNPTITNEGQDGKSGATGGNGAAGSKGSSGSSGKNSCSTQPGKGGTGQSGKPGGNGGNGGTVNIIYSSSAPGTSFQFSPNPNKGKAGQGGRGGNAGSGGQGSPTGGGGNAGKVGSNGTTGTPGRIYVNNVPIN
ncbi:hypothetical protein J2Z22_000671 [Paenibacillus forsythiae]|uniref:Collagen-like protein n=1 Tax=Paenibacillus forsythiae TaxID=365616 RepID=A0ABU3H2V9_9BACL|nr:hypothetical protein [Paenibacillus forsythiae]MDT3425158.1 hypothetical protein [Paenibacillus forsythiae]